MSAPVLRPERSWEVDDWRLIFFLRGVQGFRGHEIRPHHSTRATDARLWVSQPSLSRTSTIPKPHESKNPRAQPSLSLAL